MSSSVVEAPRKSETYHHGNLKNALFEAARVLANEVGVDNFTLREVGGGGGGGGGTGPSQPIPPQNKGVPGGGGSPPPRRTTTLPTKTILCVAWQSKPLKP
jgi:hypothetical protein